VTITELAGTAGTTYPYSATPHASTAVGQPMVLAVWGLSSQSNPLSLDDTITTTWSLLGRREQVGYNVLGGASSTANDQRDVMAVYGKIATAGDLGASVPVTFGARFGAYTQAVQIFSYPGAVGFVGSAALSGFDAGYGSATFTPTIFNPSSPSVRGLIFRKRSAGGGASVAVANGWTSQGGGQNWRHHLYGAPPLTPPSFAVSSTGAAFVAINVTDIAGGGLRLGKLHLNAARGLS